MKFLQSMVLSKQVVYCITICLFFAVSFGFVLNVNAAQFESGDVVRVEDVRENLYVTGSDVDIVASIQKDLVASGSTVRVTGDVERNIYSAAESVTITENTIGGGVQAAANRIVINDVSINQTVRLAAGTIEIRNTTINEDLITAAGIIKLENVTINGDLITTSDSLEMREVIVTDSLTGWYSQYDGDNIDEQVQGEVTINQIDSEEIENEEREASGLPIWLIFGYVFHQPFAVIIFVLVVGGILIRRNLFPIPDTSEGLSVVKNMFTGFIVFIVSLVILLISIIASFIPFGGVLALAPILIPITMILIFMYALSGMFIPIYISNILKQMSQFTNQSQWTVLWGGLGIWLVIYLLTFIPIAGILFGLIIWLLQLASFGLWFNFLRRNLLQLK